jgi:hypothetical protein
LNLSHDSMAENKATTKANTKILKRYATLRLSFQSPPQRIHPYDDDEVVI